MKRGNCYVTSEALYHLLGGKSAGWVPMRVRFGGDMHWYLHHAPTGMVIDATVKQFSVRRVPYAKARGCGFLTKRPSKRARELMERLVWQEKREIHAQQRSMTATKFESRRSPTKRKVA